MKRSALIIINVLFASGLVGLVIPAHAASVPKTLTTCTNTVSGVIHVLAKGSCTTKETKGGWVQLSGAAASKVIFTCMNKSGVVRMFVQGKCDNKFEMKTAWVRSPTSEDISDTLCASGGRCVVGDIGPGGGMVFYAVVKLQKWGRYLEAASPKGWQSGGVDPEYVWCEDTTTLVGATATAIGSGSANSKKIVSKCKAGAAVAVHAYRGGGKSDWFLPSKDELNQLYLNLNVVYGFFPDTYWSSTEFDGTSVWYRQVTFGAQGHTAKDTMFYVRPVRAF